MTIAALLLDLIATPNAEDSGRPVLLDFHASGCGPCREMRPVVSLLSEKGYPIRSVDISESPDLAERYKVGEVPTFIVIDGSGRLLGRTKGVLSPTQLANFYRAASAKAVPRKAPRPRVDEDDDQHGTDSDASDSGDDAPERAPRRLAAKNPEPWKTGVRIKVHGNGMMGFGSGTIIYSDPDESIILTCAHIFKVEGQQPVHPKHFRNPIEIDLFDGNLVRTRISPNVISSKVNPVETVKGEAIDYDFSRDVGLIRIRPGRRLPASPIVPPSWTPKVGATMTTVGCSEGNDATAWTTHITRPPMRGFLSGNAVYEAIECAHPPRQGRSGGGLYTQDNYVAGVCDFAEPVGQHGLYASPRSIYAILDRNQLTALYSPDGRDGGRLLASGRSTKPRRPRASIARAQSPDEESAPLTVPDPKFLHISTPNVAQASSSGEISTARPKGWHSPNDDDPQPADISLPEEVNNDHFDDEPAPAPAVPETVTRPKTKWRPVRIDPTLSPASEK
jgi:thiol-disulfide isomerase/thioredoxin